MPPQGILVVAAYLPQNWEVRFIDENINPTAATDYQWADVVIVSGLHIQRPHINQINELAHRWGKIMIVGGLMKIYELWWNLCKNKQVFRKVWEDNE